MGRSRRDEVRLIVMVFIDQAEEIVAHAKIDGQLVGDLPIVVHVTAVIILAVVGFRDVGTRECR